MQFKEMTVDNTILILAIAAATPFACALVAKGKNKSTTGWFCWGLIFGLFALAAVLLLPSE